MSFFSLCLAFLVSIAPVSAGLFDWFYPNVQKKEMFECPHGCVRYICPENKQFEIRVSPGISTSPLPAHQNPYVIHRTDKGFLDINGKIYKDTCGEIHIPVNEYNFEKLSRIVPPHE